MKKKLILLLVCIIAIAALLGLYFFKSGGAKNESAENNETEEAELTAANDGQYQLCDKNPEDIRDIVITRDGEQTIEMTLGDDYKVVGYESVSLNQTSAASFASIFVGLASDSTVEGELATFGLDNPAVIGKATYADGSEVTLSLGSLTADGAYYYMQSSELDGVYLVNAILAGRMLYTVNDMVDKDIASLKQDYIDYIEVINKNGNELFMYYNENYANKEDAATQSGLPTLTMEKPFKGLTVYPNNLEDTVLSTLSKLVLGDVADAQPEDYAKYGLDAPSLIVRLKDDENAVEFNVGDEAEDGKVYVKVANKVSVFTMDKSVFEPFENYNVADFVDRFVSLHYRYELSYADVKTEYGNFKMEYTEDGDNKISTNENGATEDTRIVTVDGKELSDDDYIELHGLLVGLTFDSIVEPKTESGEPACTIVYGLLDGSTQTIKLYTENSNFYRIPMDESYDVLVDKQSVKNIINKVNELK